jgi:hypothetical protein
MSARKYNQNFERDFSWYLAMRHEFNFDGSSNYYNKKGESIVQYSEDGVDGKEAFFQWDSNGKIKPTKHPNILYTMLKTKGSCNLHVKMYAEDRASCNLDKIEFRAICNKIKAPRWFVDAVEQQKMKYWK